MHKGIASPSRSRPRRSSARPCNAATPRATLAAAKGCTPAQLALAWLLAQGDDIVPIPGTKRRAYLDENAAALAVTLDGADHAALAETFVRDAAAGTRYPPGQLRRIGI